MLIQVVTTMGALDRDKQLEVGETAHDLVASASATIR